MNEFFNYMKSKLLFSTIHPESDFLIQVATKSEAISFYSLKEKNIVGNWQIKEGKSKIISKCFAYD